MTSDEIFDVIARVSETASKNSKEAILARFSHDADFRRTLEYAYNPFKTYGIRKRPDRLPRPNALGRHMNDATWQLLDDLVARRITGAAAIERVGQEISYLTDPSAEVFWRIISKDLRAGFSEGTINRVCKGLVPDFPYMRCALPKDAKWERFDFAAGAFSQKKADGMFANINVEESRLVSITSRQGSAFPIEKFPHDFLVELAACLVVGHQHHGELLIERDGKILPREIGNGIFNSVLAGGDLGPGDRPIYEAWDCIPIDAVKTKGKYGVPYWKRFELLRKIMAVDGVAESSGRGSGFGSVRLVETRVVHSLEAAYAHYTEVLERGDEGTILKDRHAIWEDKTSKWQIKLKLDVDVDLKITAIQPGRAGTKNEGRPGAFSVESSCGGLRVDVTIKNEDLRDRVEADPSDFIGRIVAVRANSIMRPSERTATHSLFLPRMVEPGYRADKSQADDLQRIKDQFDSAIRPGARLPVASSGDPEEDFSSAMICS